MLFCKHEAVERVKERLDIITPAHPKRRINADTACAASYSMHVFGSFLPATGKNGVVEDRALALHLSQDRPFQFYMHALRPPFSAHKEMRESPCHTRRYKKFVTEWKLILYASRLLTLIVLIISFLSQSSSALEDGLFLHIQF